MQLNLNKTMKRMVESSYDTDPQNAAVQAFIPALLMSNAELERVPGQNRVIRHIPSDTLWPVTVTGHSKVAECRRYVNGEYSGIVTYSIDNSAVYVINYGCVWVSKNGSRKAGARRYINARARLTSGTKYE